MSTTTPTIFIVDDDPAVRDSLALLLSAQGLRTVTYPNAHAFLDEFRPGEIGCLVLDIRMPQLSGLGLQELLNEQPVPIPTVFITGHGDVEQCSRAFRNGAIDFLTKPVDPVRLIDCLRRGVKMSIQQHAQEAETQEVVHRLAKISNREREVLDLVVDGLTSKEIARALDLSARTVEVHRSNLFIKLGVDSLADLIRFYLRAIETGARQRVE
jgi:FixJ family two-component response regulator